MNDQNRIYHVVTHLSTRRPLYAFTGKNAKRDAIRLAQRTGGKAKVMTGEEWKDAREL